MDDALLAITKGRTRREKERERERERERVTWEERGRYSRAARGEIVVRGIG